MGLTWPHYYSVGKLLSYKADFHLSNTEAWVRNSTPSLMHTFLNFFLVQSWMCLHLTYSKHPTRLNHTIHNVHDGVIRWKHFPRCWPFVRDIHRSPVNSPHKGQWRGALMFSLICTWINSWVNSREAGDLRRRRAHYDVIVMCYVENSHRKRRRCQNAVFI